MKFIRNTIYLFLIFLVFGTNVCSQKLSMKDAVKTALENNREIKAAELNIAKEQAAQLKAFNIPRPELFIEYEGIKGSLKNYESRKIGFLQELEFPTSYFLRSDVQNSQIKIAEQELNRQAIFTKFEVENSYLNLQLSFSLLEIAKENLKIYNDFLFVAGKKYNAGSSSNLEVLSAKVRKIKLENEIKNLKSGINTAISELGKLMNTTYSEIEITDEFTFKPIIFSKDELLTAAMTNNPDLKIISLKKETISGKISLSKSELLPNFSFRYYKQKIGNDADFWGVEFGIGVPLWFWLESTGNINEAVYDFKIAAEEELNIKRTVENDVNRVFEEYENWFRQSIFFQDEAIFEVNEIFRQAKISYEEGAIDYIEYLQALQTLYETRTQYLHSIYNYKNSIIKLELLTAGKLI